MGYSWTKLTQDESGRKGAKQSFALALILMMFAGVFAFILPATGAAGSKAKTNLEGFDKTAGKWSTGNLDGWKELDWVPYRLTFIDLPEGTSSYTFNVYNNNLSEDKDGVDRLMDFRVGDEDGNPVTGSVTVSGPFYETLGKWGDRDIYYTISVSFTTPSPRLSWYLYWQAHLAYGASGWPGSSLHAYTDISGKVSINVPPTPVGSISGYKWNDLNRDGTWDPNEQGISGWTIQLYSFDPVMNAWIHLADENTDSAGRYTFALVAGSYRLYEVLKGNWTQTFPPSGSYEDIVLSEGETKDNINFGNFLIPTITTRSATGITTNRATMNADFTIGSYDSVDIWFQYRVQGGDTWIETTPTTYTSSGSYSDDATGLSSDTTYEFRAVLQYDNEIIYGGVLTFTTSKIIPTVTTRVATGVTATQATLNADFTVGIYDSVDVWFQYRVQGGDTWIGTTPATYTLSGSHSDDATGLSPVTTYEFRAVLQYDTENIYGDPLTFTTKAVQLPSAPTLQSPADGTITNDNTPTFKWTVGANANNHRLLADNDADFSSPEKNVLLGAADNTYTISAPGLADGNHSWKIIAINADGENESSIWTFFIDTIAPSIPTPNLPADSASTNDNTVYFEWSSIPDAEYYDLFIDDDLDFSSPEVIVTVTDNYYTSSALPDGSYYWRVRARDAANNMIDNSATRTFLIDTIASSSPTLFLPADGTMTNDNTVYFEWFIIVDAENYDLLVDDDSDFNSPEVSVTVTNNYYTSSALGDESYFWRVRARYADNEIYNSVTWTFVIDTIAPATSKLVSPENNAVESALTQTFTWTEPEAGVMYDIQIDNETSFTSPYVHENTGLADNSYTYTFASNGVYYWRVRAVDHVYNQSSWDNNFKLAIQAPPGQPTLYLSSDGVITNDNTHTFEWTVGVVADYYLLLVDNDPDFSSPEENRILLDNYYTMTGENSLPDDNYSWKVIAINAYGEIESSTWTFVIDTVAPSIPTPSLPADGDSMNDSTVYFEWSNIPDAEYYDLFIDDDPDFSSPEISVTVTNNYYTSSALPDGSYSWRVRACDAANNMSDDSTTRTFLIDTTQVSPGDNDTTLMTVLPPLEGARTVTIGTIRAGETGSADFTRHAITVTGVRITTTRDVSGARVDVKMHPAKPVGVDEIALHVYIYFDLSTTVDGVYIDGATIRFRVPRSWIAEMNIDEGTIRLLRYKGTWQRLPTGMISADSTYFHYEANTSGFSLFAIVGESRVAPTSTSWGTPTVPPSSQPPPFMYAAVFMSAGIVGLAMAYSFARPSRYYVMLKRLKQLERELIQPRVRHIGLPLPEPPAGVAQIRTYQTRDKREEGGIMSKARKAFRKFKVANRKLWTTQRELHHMEENRWSFRKNMLRFGFASWVFGLSVFLFAITLMSTELFGGAPVAWSSMLVGTPLLLGAPAAPVTMTSVFMRKHDNKIKRLRHIRRGLVTKYQGAVLQYVEQEADSRVKNVRVRKA